ncbi:MAG: ATP-binding protein [Bacteroidota bacterium]
MPLSTTSLPSVLYVGVTVTTWARVQAALPQGVTWMQVKGWGEVTAALRATPNSVIVAETGRLPEADQMLRVGRRAPVVALVDDRADYGWLAEYGVADVLDAATFSPASLWATVQYAYARSGAQAPIAARFRSLVQAAPDIIARLDAQGNVLDVHIPTEFKTAVTKAMTRRSDLDQVVGAAVMDRILAACHASLASGVRERVQYETTVRGQTRYREAVCLAISDEDFLVVVRDTTALVESEAQRVQAASALARSASELQFRSALLQQVARSAPIVFFSLDAEGRFMQVEGRGLDTLDVGSQDLVGESVLERYATTNTRIVRAVRRALGGERVSVLIEQGGRAFETTYTPVTDDDGAVVQVIGVATDVTDRLEAQEELQRSRTALRELAAHLQSVREQERRRISREVHDVLGQALTALRLNVGWLAQRLPDEPPIAKRVATTEALIDDTIKHVRQIAAQLRPGVLDDFGLVSAMEWYTEQFTAQAEIPVIFEAAPDVDETEIAGEVATALFRILQEALTNVARHAQATRVTVALDLDQDRLCLRVRDDGVGMDPQRQTRTLGLLGMRERALILDGTVEITSAPGRGTTLAAEVPLRGGTSAQTLDLSYLITAPS